MDIKGEIINTLSDWADAVKEEAGQKYGRDAVSRELDEVSMTMTMHLEGKANVYRETGSVKTIPDPRFYRAYRIGRERMLKRISQGVRDKVKEELFKTERLK